MQQTTIAPVARESRRSHGLWQSLVRLTQFVAAGLCLATFATLVAPFHWAADLTTHFRWQYVVVSLATTPILFRAKRRWQAVVVGGCGVFHASMLLPVYFSGDLQPADAEEPIRILIANVLSHNKNSAAVTNLIDAEAPDVVVLMEVTNRWVEDLSELDEQYTWSYSYPRSDNFGIAVWSRIAPLEPITLRLNNTPELELRLAIGATPIRLFAVHPVPPAGRAYSERRNQHLVDLTQRIRDSSGPVIVVGDLNLTPWSPWFQRLINDTSLTDGRAGRGIVTTWPTSIAPLRIPIDHCLVSSELTVIDLRRGPRIGSDHFPLICDVAVRKR